MLFLRSTLLALLISLATADRIAFSFCNYCSASPSGGAPTCNSAVYQHNGDGDGDCNNFQTGDIAQGGCTPSDSVDTPMGEARYEVVDGCETRGPGELKGGLVEKANSVGFAYSCFVQEGEFSNTCGIITFACQRMMECVSV